LYRNGAAEALYYFNITIDLYTEDLHVFMDEKAQLVLALILAISGVIAMFFLFVVIPMFVRLNNLRREYWQLLFDGFKLNGLTISARCIERQMDIHQSEATILDRPIKHKKGSSQLLMKYS
jgi:hypothetical protein